MAVLCTVRRKRKCACGVRVIQGAPTTRGTLNPARKIIIKGTKGCMKLEDTHLPVREPQCMEMYIKFVECRVQLSSNSTKG